MPIENVKVGVCSVTFNGTDLGYTKGGVEVEISTDTYVSTVDQFGTTGIKEFVTGRNVRVTTPFAEPTVDNLVALMPGAMKIVDSVDNTKIKVEVPNALGTDLLALAQKLVLHPIAAGASVAEDVIIPKAATEGNMTFAFRQDEERVFNVTWKAYPDIANSNNLFIMGDESASA